MKHLILIISILIGSISPSFGRVSYGIAPSIENNIKKKQRGVKRGLFKQKRKPNKTDSKSKVTWLMIAGIICTAISLVFVLLMILFYISTGLIGGLLFFGGLAIISFILASIYSKNVGVRGGRGGQNQGKATY